MQLENRAGRKRCVWCQEQKCARVHGQPAYTSFSSGGVLKSLRTPERGIARGTRAARPYSAGLARSAPPGLGADATLHHR